MASSSRSIDGPIVLTGLFGGDDSEEEDEAFEQYFEVQEKCIAGVSIKIRQFAWHSHNANQVWPGSFNLAEYMDGKREIYSSGKLLELGSATGILSIWLINSDMVASNQIVTSDIDDGGDVESNIQHNFELNGLKPSTHIPFTWGCGWNNAVDLKTSNGLTSESAPDGSKELVDCRANCFKYIIASDILLYVSTYPALVDTLVELFDGGTVEEFLMSWTRRIAESKIFFDLMATAGFTMEVKTSGIYSFVRNIKDGV